MARYLISFPDSAMSFPAEDLPDVAKDANEVVKEAVDSADIVLADRNTGLPVRKICVQSEDGRALKLSDLVWVSRADTEAARRGRAA